VGRGVLARPAGPCSRLGRRNAVAALREGTSEAAWLTTVADDCARRRGRQPPARSVLTPDICHVLEIARSDRRRAGGLLSRRRGVPFARRPAALDRPAMGRSTPGGALPRRPGDHPRCIASTRLMRATTATQAFRGLLWLWAPGCTDEEVDIAGLGQLYEALWRFVVAYKRKRKDIQKGSLRFTFYV
jgi:hypothetical protein